MVRRDEYIIRSGGIKSVCLEEVLGPICRACLPSVMDRAADADETSLSSVHVINVV